MTFSIVARCTETGMLGGAVCSSSPAVASRCLSVRSQVGAALTQNFTDPTLGAKCTDLLAMGASAQQAMDIVVAGAEQAAYRQLALISLAGAPAAYTGTRCMDATAEAVGADCVAVGNLLASPQIAQRMVDAFAASRGHLATRLLDAMQAGLAAGGEREAVHSAGIVVSHDLAWPIVNLRIDWTPGDPISELQQLWQRWQLVMPTYMARALTPQHAPAEDH
jgi:uncharacterized Ntn-hydrolase superfamily protein